MFRYPNVSRTVSYHEVDLEPSNAKEEGCKVAKPSRNAKQTHLVTLREHSGRKTRKIVRTRGARICCGIVLPRNLRSYNHKVSLT